MIEEPLDGACLAEIEINDLVEQLYSKERGLWVAYYGIQLEERWTFVATKANKPWLWLALNPINRQIVAFYIGGRSREDAQLFYKKNRPFSRVVLVCFLIIGKLILKCLRRITILG